MQGGVRQRSNTPCENLRVRKMQDNRKVKADYSLNHGEPNWSLGGGGWGVLSMARWEKGG